MNSRPDSPVPERPQFPRLGKTGVHSFIAWIPAGDIPVAQCTQQCSMAKLDPAGDPVPWAQPAPVTNKN